MFEFLFSGSLAGRGDDAEKRRTAEDHNRFSKYLQASHLFCLTLPLKICLLLFVLGLSPRIICSAKFPDTDSTHIALQGVQLCCLSLPMEGSTQAGRDNPHCANLRV